MTLDAVLVIEGTHERWALVAELSTALGFKIETADSLDLVAPAFAIINDFEWGHSVGLNGPSSLISAAELERGVGALIQKLKTRVLLPLEGGDWLVMGPDGRRHLLPDWAGDGPPPFDLLG